MATSLVTLTEATRQTSEKFPSKYKSNIGMNKNPDFLKWYLILKPQKDRTAHQNIKISIKRKKVHAIIV